MARISIDEVKPGMIVGADVYDKKGRFLLGEGAEVTEKYIRVMKMWGVWEIVTCGEDQEDNGTEEVDVDDQTLKQAKSIRKKRYAHTNTKHICVRTIFKLDAYEYAQKMVKGEVDHGCKTAFKNDSDGNNDAWFAQNPITPQSLIKKNMKLSTLPDIFQKISDVVNNPRSSALDIARVVENDSSLSAKLLRLVNSAFYGFPQSIDSISRAITILGTKELSSLAVGVSVVNIFNNIPNDYINMESFWRHSLAVGICSRILASNQDVPNTEKVFVGGLLHDIGRLIMLQYAPERMKRAMDAARHGRMSLNEGEKKFLGFEHAKAGSVLANKWLLPPMLEDVIHNHHQPASSKHQTECSTVHIANVIVGAMSIGSSGEDNVPYLNDKAWQLLQLSEGCLRTVIKQTQAEVENVIKFLM